MKDAGLTLRGSRLEVRGWRLEVGGWRLQIFLKTTTDQYLESSNVADQTKNLHQEAERQGSTPNLTKWTLSWSRAENVGLPTRTV